MPDLAVDIQNVAHRYGDHVALRGVTLGVEPGALFGLLGPNGGGKTTLFRVLSTLLRPTEGRATVFGFDTWTEPAAVRQRLGVVFQQPALDAELTVRENLRFHGALYGLKRAPLADRINALLDTFGLADRADDRIKTLSGGLQRRADLARGLLHRPKLLLLDEPTTGLDPLAREAFWHGLARLRRDEGTTMLVATHLLDEADACDALAILDRGRLVAEGTPDDLKSALGGETLWIDTDDAADLADHIQAQFGFDAQALGARVQISHPEAHTLLPALYDAFGDAIDSATVRRPTLGDVFAVHTGYRLGETPAAPPRAHPHTPAASS